MNYKYLRSQSISWDLGTFIPEDITCGPFSLLKNQTRIENVSLITDANCDSNIETQYSVDLVQFTTLQSLTWRGLSRFEDFESVRKCITTNGKQMKSLTLDLINWTRAKSTYIPLTALIIAVLTSFCRSALRERDETIFDSR